jgi:hypothetical protein
MNTIIALAEQGFEYARKVKTADGIVFRGVKRRSDATHRVQITKQAEKPDASYDADYGRIPWLHYPILGAVVHPLRRWPRGRRLAFKASKTPAAKREQQAVAKPLAPDLKDYQKQYSTSVRKLGRVLFVPSVKPFTANPYIKDKPYKTMSKKKIKKTAKAKAKPSPKAKVKAKAPVKAKPVVPAKPITNRKELAKLRVKVPNTRGCIAQNGISRPRPTSLKTVKVWEIADKISADSGAPALRQAVLDACKAANVNQWTASVHYARWRRFNGLKGRGNSGVASK